MSHSTPKEPDPRWAAQVTAELTAAVLAKAVEGRVPCAVLRRLAEESGVSYKVAGAAADMAEVRVQHCDLGCF